MADLAVWQRTIVDEEGNVIPGAEVEVRREEDGSLATLYADRAGETPLANPLAADMSGFVRFFAQGDAYTITAVGAGSTRTWRFDPTGRLQEFDRISEALVADDAADLVAARANLGTFSTVADVQNSHIPAVLDSIRTNGFAAPGDGGGAPYKRVVSEPAHEGKILSGDGTWWEIAEKVVTPQMFGEGQAALEAAVNFALLTGAEIHWPEGDYESTDTIPGLHAVRSSGPGVIVRDGYRWHITPVEISGAVQENRLYYAVDGDNANDGITPDRPRQTRSRFREDLRWYDQQQKFMGGRWYFHFGPGEWSEGRLRIDFDVSSLYPINIVGSQGDRGQEIVSYGDFSRASAWSLNNPSLFDFSAEGVKFLTGGYHEVIQSVPPEIGLEEGAGYELKFTLEGVSAGVFVARLGASDGTDVSSNNITDNGEYVVTLTANADSDQIKFTANPDFNGTLKNVSVRKIVPDGEGGPTTVWTLNVDIGQVVLTDGVQLNVDNIRIVGRGRSSTTYGWATEAHGQGKVVLRNCEAENASIGFAMFRGGSFELSQCQARRCGTGFRAHYGTTFNFGRSLLGFNRAIECDRGAHISRNAIGHADCLVVEDADVAVLLDEAAPRVNFVETNFRRCAVGVDAQDNSSYLDQGINFNLGTEDACAIPFRNSGGSIDRRLYGQQSQTERRVGYSYDPLVLTTNNQFIRLGSRTILRIPPGQMSDPAKKLRVVVRGTKTGTSGGAPIDVGVTDYGSVANWQAIGSANVGSVTEGVWEMEFEITPLTLASQVTFVRTLRHQGQVTVAGPQAYSADFAVIGDRELRVRASKASADDAVTITSVEAFMLG